MAHIRQMLPTSISNPPLVSSLTSLCVHDSFLVISERIYAVFYPQAITQLAVL